MNAKRYSGTLDAAVGQSPLRPHTLYFHPPPPHQSMAEHDTGASFILRFPGDFLLCEDAQVSRP